MPASMPEPDTPVHSVLHEAVHVICASPERRATLCRDAGSNDLEEAAVCYLQVLLADYVAGVGRDRLMRDMDHWGYSFPARQHPTVVLRGRRRRSRLATRHAFDRPKREATLASADGQRPGA